MDDTEMPEPTPQERFAHLERRIAKLEKDPKDAWDKFASISTFLSGVIIGGIGIYATSTYNARQLDIQSREKTRELQLQEVQTVETFFPHLSSDKENVRRAALEAIAVLGNEQLAVRFAAYFGGEAGTSVLANLSASLNPEVAASAATALAGQFARLKGSVAVVRSGSAEVLSTGFFVTPDGLVVVPSFVLGESVNVQLPSDNSTHPAVVVVRDDASHIAVVKVQLPGPVLPVQEWNTDPMAGETALLLGFANGAHWSSMVGKVTGIVENPTGEKRIATDIKSSHGFAGAPLVDQHGRLLGMAESRDPSGLSVSIPATRVRAVVDQARRLTRR